MATLILDIALFRSVYPVYADETTYPDSVLEYWYEEGKCYIKDNDCTLPEDCRGRALMAMLAHLLFINDLAKTGNKAVNVSSATEGAVSVSLLDPPNSSNFEYWLNTSPYGSRILAMLDVESSGSFIVGGSLDRMSFRRADGSF